MGLVDEKTRVEETEELIESFGTGDPNQYKIERLLENIAVTLATMCDYEG